VKKLDKINLQLITVCLLLAIGCEDKGGPEISPTDPETNLTAVNVTAPVSAPPVSTPPEQPLPPRVSPTFTQEFMELVNDHRISIGLRPLTHDQEVAKLAQTHSQDMASGKIAFGHGGFSERCSQARVALGGGNLCGENVAYGQKTPKSVFQSWMNSPGHRANIEQSRYTHSGLGYFQKASNTYYWTHLFIEKR
jgi:uncharacterized protein YkwD